MTLPQSLWQQVGHRAGGACEYCGVTETDSAGPLTVDHFHPQSCGGKDDLDNLLYCCWRCNLYKADYWPAQPGDAVLWNPRKEPLALHCLLLADATLHALTPTGRFTIERLRLNRPPLVEYRRRKLVQTNELRLLEQYREVVTALGHLQHQHGLLLEEHRALLEEQRNLLKLLTTREA
jgi:hypothetical protein